MALRAARNSTVAPPVAPISTHSVPSQVPNRKPPSTVRTEPAGREAATTTT